MCVCVCVCVYVGGGGGGADNSSRNDLLPLCLEIQSSRHTQAVHSLKAR